MRTRKYTYIPNAEIESITTWNGKEIPGSKLLDGAYARGKVQYGEGGEMDFGDEYWIIVKTPKGLVTKKDFYGMGYNKKEIIEWCEKRGWIYNEKGEEFGGQALEEYEFFLKKPTKYDIQLPKSKMADGGMMAKGGYTSRHRKRTLEEKAQEMYGSDWFDLDERTRKELLNDLKKGFVFILFHFNLVAAINNLF
jgi:hypothetical protein